MPLLQRTVHNAVCSDDVGAAQSNVSARGHSRRGHLDAHWTIRRGRPPCPRREDTAIRKLRRVRRPAAGAGSAHGALEATRAAGPVAGQPRLLPVVDAMGSHLLWRVHRHHQPRGPGREHRADDRAVSAGEAVSGARRAALAKRACRAGVLVAGCDTLVCVIYNTQGFGAMSVSKHAASAVHGNVHARDEPARGTA